MSDLAKVGATVVIVLVLLFGIIQLIQGGLFRGRNTYYVMVYFENGLGLRKNLPLKMAGTEVGYVEDTLPVELTREQIRKIYEAARLSRQAPSEADASGWTEQRGAEGLGRVDRAARAIKAAGRDQRLRELALSKVRQFTRAKIRIYQTVKRQPVNIYVDARFVIGQEGLIGDKFLDVDGGQGNIPVEEGHEFFGRTEADITALIDNASAVVQSVGELLSDENFGGALRDVAGTLNQSMGNVDTLIANVNGLVEGSQGYVTASLINVQKMSENFLALSQNLEDTSVSIRQLADDPEYHDSIVAMTKDLQQVSQNLSHLSAQLDTLVSDPQLQQDAKDSVRLTKETLEEAKKTLERFRQTMDKADGVLDGASGLMDDAGGAISEARGKMQQLSDLGQKIDVKLGMNIRAVDRNDNQGLDNDDSYVGDMNVAVGYENSYIQVGADNIGEDNNFNFLLGMGELSGFSFRGGVYRSELGLGAAYNLPAGGGAEVMLYDTEDPKLNAYGHIPVGDSISVVVGMEDIENDPMATVGVGVSLR